MKRKILVGLVLTTMVIMNLGVAIFTLSPQSVHEENVHVRAYLSGLTEHGPIKVNTDWDLDHTDGITYNDTNDVYRINGLKIDSKGEGYGIYIGNITKHLIIENCEVYNVSGGNYGLLRSNAGIKIYGVKNGGRVTITHNFVHDTQSAGIYIALSGGNSGNDAIYVSDNYIFNSSRAGVYGGSSSNISLRNNVIFNNDVGVHYNNVEKSDIMYNGIGENKNEGVRITSSNEVKICVNIFYHNRGSGDRYDEKHIQATQDSSSRWIDWDDGAGNYWHDWAMNNESNWYAKHGDYYTEYKIKWPYHIVDLNGVVRNNDSYPNKVDHIGGLHSSQHASFTFGDFDIIGFPKNLTGEHGVVFGIGTSYMPFKVVGAEFNLTDEAQGIVNKADHIYFINVWMHNSSDSGSTGIGFENYGDDTHVLHANIFNCTNAGIVLKGQTDVYVEHSYIHDNSYFGIYTEDMYLGFAKIYMNTISNNRMIGIYINSTTSTIISYNVISNNGVIAPPYYNGFGIYVDNYQGPKVNLQNNSFFRNAQYGVYVKNGTSSNYAKVIMKDNIFHGNNGATEEYNASHNQVYIGAGTNLYSVKNNFFNDWVYNHHGLGWHLPPYKFKGIGEDGSPARWVNFTWGHIYINNDMATYYNYNGTQNGIIGYHWSYWIEGWNVKSYDNFAGIYITDVDSSINIKGCNVSNIHGTGISVSYISHTVDIFDNVVNNNDQVGISAAGIQYINIGSNIVSNNGDSGIYLDHINGGFPSIVSNRIYRNGYDGMTYGVYLKDIHSVSKYSAVDYNQISINYGGIYAYDIDTIRIIRNGIAYNEKYGVKLEGSTGVKVENNTFYENNGTTDHFDAKHIQAYDDGNNIWNWSGGGNYWHDWAMNNNTNDPDGDYIINYAYPIDGVAKDGKPFLYIKHLPFRINSYWDEIYDNGVIGGDGTSQYPFVIVGWRVNGENNGYGIYIGNTTDEQHYTYNLHLKMDHCLVYNASGGSGNDYYSNSGIIVNSVYPYAVAFNYLTIENTISTGNNNHGLSILDSRDITVTNSNFSYNQHSGIYTRGVELTDINGISAIHNAFYGAYLTLGSTVNIENSNMSYNNWSGIFVYESGVNIQSSTIYKNGYGSGTHHEGIVLSDGTGGEIHDNIIKENKGYGIKAFNGAKGFKIYRNQFIGNNGASETGSYDPHILQAYDDGAKYDNLWNTSTEGNCWSDNPTASVYTIDGGDSEDDHPGCGFVPELSPAVLIFALMSMLAAGVLRRRKH